jgi:hypothetical protein
MLGRFSFMSESFVYQPAPDCSLEAAYLYCSAGVSVVVVVEEDGRMVECLS